MILAGKTTLLVQMTNYKCSYFAAHADCCLVQASAFTMQKWAKDVEVNWYWMLEEPPKKRIQDTKTTYRGNLIYVC